MKYVVSTVVIGLLVLSASWASADPPAVPQATVAAVMEGSGQALLYDRTQDSYVVVRVGDEIQGFEVVAIQRDQVVLTARATSVQFVLPRISEIVRLDDRIAPPAPAASAAPKVTRLDPPALAPIDPYYEEKPEASSTYDSTTIVAVVAPEASRADEAPGEAGGTAFAAAPAADAAPALAPATTDPAVPTAAPMPVPDATLSSPPARPSVADAVPATAATTETAPTPAASGAAPAPAGAPALAPAPAATPAVAPSAPAAAPGAEESARVQTLVRAEFESALSDFHALSKELKLALREDGVEIVELAPGTLFHRLGLRAGDRVLRVAGQPVRDHETAAAAYSRLMAADEVEVVVARGAREVSLRFRFAR